MGLRKKAEEYGYVVCLAKEYHVNGASCAYENWADLDHWLKRKCQEHFIEVAHKGTKEDWYQIFGRFYDDYANEDVPCNKSFEWDLRR